MNSAFWGTSVAANTEEPLELPEDIVLTIQNVAIRDASSDARLTLQVAIEDEDEGGQGNDKYTICTLASGKLEQFSCNINFFPGDRIKMSVKGTGTGTVDLMGVLEAVEEEDMYDDLEEGEEDEEDEEDAPELAAIAPSKKAKIESLPAPKKPEAPKQQQQPAKKDNKPEPKKDNKPVQAAPAAQGAQGAQGEGKKKKKNKKNKNKQE